MKRIFCIYTPQSPNLTLKGGMPCILPMAIIGLLKVSCEGRRAEIITTAARTARSRSAGAAEVTGRTERIGIACSPSVPTPQAA